MSTCRCGSPARNDRKSCGPCGQRNAMKTRERSARLVRSGLCGICGKNPLLRGIRCGPCNARRAEWDRGHSHARPKPTVVELPVKEKSKPGPKPQPSVTAKFQVICPRCKNLILPGSLIKKGITRWRHLTCPPKAAKTRKSAAEIRAETAERYWAEEYRRCNYTPRW